MKKLFLTLCVLFILPGCSLTSDNEYYSYDYLKNDYDQVAVVASVEVEEAKAVDSIGDNTAGYVRYLVRGHVVEPFKGDVKSGQALEYYSVAEKGYDPENYRGKKIVFLCNLFDKQKNDRVLSELENSTRPASKAIIRKMRKITEKAGIKKSL
ncbi:MAG: hypothetical protein A2Y65_01725 [Deltaproteobacteria bacterium RBG_13_52_11]|nr:MAG: hypothetical protein A2Y65_01725 [Deltaproteobacteria bacterium RBG_13_52_11]